MDRNHPDLADAELRASNPGSGGPAPLDPVRTHSLIADLATALSRARADDLDGEVDRALQLVGELLGLDSLVVAVADGGVLGAIGTWRASNWLEPPLSIDLDRATWIRAQLEAGDEIAISLLPRLPGGADHERHLFADRGTGAFAIVPVAWAGPTSCLLAESTVAGRTWSSVEMRVLDALASAVAAAYERRAYQQALIDDARTARVELEQTNRFVALFAHELRSPLTAIVGYAEMLAAGVGGQLSDGQSRYLTDILDGARTLGDLISSGLDLVQIDEGRMPLRLTDLDVVTLIDSTMTQLGPRAREAGIELTSEVAVERLPVRGDGQRLLQILVNLTGNAVKFTPAGGQVRVCLHADELDYRLEVADTGVGIPARDLDRIFDKFARLDSRTARDREGIGLGLPLVKRLVELHGGAVEVESTPGQGSTFRVTLPRTPPPPPAGGPPYIK